MDPVLITLQYIINNVRGIKYYEGIGKKRSFLDTACANINHLLIPSFKGFCFPQYLLD